MAALGVGLAALGVGLAAAGVLPLRLCLWLRMALRVRRSAASSKTRRRLVVGVCARAEEKVRGLVRWIGCGRERWVRGGALVGAVLEEMSLGLKLDTHNN